MDDLQHSLTSLTDLLAAGEQPRKRKPQPKEGSERLCLTLNGFLIDLLRRTGVMRVEELNRHVKDNIARLRRSDGSNYKGDLYKILIGVLSNCSAFLEKPEGWTIDEENARNYEESTLKNINRRLGKYRIKSYDDRKAAKLFQQRVKACESVELLQLIDAGNVQLLDPAFHARIADIEPVVLSWSSSSEAVSSLGRERLAGMVYMLRLLQESHVLKGIQPHADLSDMRRKVTRLTSELYDVEKSLTREEDRLD